jgi:16S rRNA (cytosine967-C5)-methyltransferase
LKAQQLQLLLNASNVVKVGGRLVYSTCSVEKEENELVVAEFLRKQERFGQIPQKAGFLSSSGAIRTWPHRHGTDGFFVAAFESNQSEI